MFEKETLKNEYFFGSQILCYFFISPDTLEQRLQVHPAVQRNLRLADAGPPDTMEQRLGRKHIPPPIVEENLL